MKIRLLALATAVGAALMLPASASVAAEAGPTRSADCAQPAATGSFRHLSVPAAREILNHQFSADGSPQAPLSFDGLDYACVTSYRSEDLREVAVFGRNGASDLRLFVNGAGEAARLEDAINRLIQEARREQAKTKKATPRARP